MAYDASTTTSAESFDPADEADWIFAAEKALRGKPLASLDTTTPDGVTCRPLYTPLHHGTAEDESGLPGAGPRTRGGRGAGTVRGWDIRQAHVVTDAAKTNEAILTDLERGLTSITLSASPTTAQELDETLADVYLDLAGIHAAHRESRIHSEFRPGLVRHRPNWRLRKNRIYRRRYQRCSGRGRSFSNFASRHAPQHDSHRNRRFRRCRRWGI